MEKSRLGGGRGREREGSDERKSMVEVRGYYKAGETGKSSWKGLLG